MTDEPSGCPICGKSVKHIQGHIKTQHPEHYTPLKPGRKTPANAVVVQRKKKVLPPIATDEVVTTVLRAVCGPVVAVEHVPAIMRWAKATDDILFILQPQETIS